MFELTVGEYVDLAPSQLYAVAGIAKIPGPRDYPKLTGPTVPGLTVDPNMIDGIQGTPLSAGTFTFTISKDDAYGDSTEIGRFDLNITAAPVPEPEPGEPEPEPVDDTPQKVLRFMGLEATPEALSTAREHTRVVTTFVHGYTRGRGFTGRTPGLDIEDVIISATSRYMLNPQQAKRQQIGDQSIAYASLEGFTLAEKAVLHRYRRRTA